MGCGARESLGTDFLVALHPNKTDSPFFALDSHCFSPYNAIQYQYQNKKIFSSS
jgi:hypothetical protein